MRPPAPAPGDAAGLAAGAGGPDAPVPRRAPRGARWRLAVALLALAPVSVLAALELGTYAAVGSGLAEARRALDARDYARAVAIDDDLAARSGFPYLLARTRLGGLARDAAAARLQWADQLAAGGRVDEALAQAASPQARQQLPDQAHRAQASVALADAVARAGRGDFDGALGRLDQLGSSPPGDLAARAGQLRPEYMTGAAEQLVAAGRDQQALGQLDAVIAAAPSGPAAERARALLPRALLGAAQQLIAAHDPPSAAILLTRLVHDFGASREAAQARTLLNQPQPVTGTVVHGDGSPYAGVELRLGSFGRTVADRYTTSPPYFTATSDRNGDFLIDGVPVGGPYVLEFNTGGGWRTAITDQGGFGYQIQVSPQTPGDFAYVEVS